MSPASIAVGGSSTKLVNGTDPLSLCYMTKYISQELSKVFKDSQVLYQSHKASVHHASQPDISSGRPRSCIRP